MMTLLSEVSKIKGTVLKIQRLCSFLLLVFYIIMCCRRPFVTKPRCCELQPFLKTYRHDFHFRVMKTVCK